VDDILKRWIARLLGHAPRGCKSRGRWYQEPAAEVVLHSVSSECLDGMERSAVKMGLDFDSSKEHYYVKVSLRNVNKQVNFKVCEL
jgi:hypothetical protein